MPKEAEEAALSYESQEHTTWIHSLSMIYDHGKWTGQYLNPNKYPCSSATTTLEKFQDDLLNSISFMVRTITYKDPWRIYSNFTLFI